MTTISDGGNTGSIIKPVWRFPLGVDNRSRETALPDSALRDCENMDITREGTLMSRRGLSRLLSGACHSLFALPSGAGILLVQNGQLSRSGGGEMVELLSVNPTAPMHYAELNGEVYFTNGSEQGRIDASGSLAPWGLPAPPPPRVEVVSGAFRAGTLRVTQAAVVDGLESGAPEPTVVAVPDGGGVRVTVPTGADFAVYATGVDGDVFRQAALVPSGGTITIGGPVAGRVLDSLLAVQPPAGSTLTPFKGRLWISVGELLFFTSDLSQHWLFPDRDSFLFDSPIRATAAVEDGLFVGTKRAVHFLSGTDPSQMTMRTIAHAGLVAVTHYLPAGLAIVDGLPLSSGCVMLLDDGSLYVGRPGGILQSLAKDRYSFGRAVDGHIAYSERESTRQLVVVANDPIPLSAVDAAISLA